MNEILSRTFCTHVLENAEIVDAVVAQSDGGEVEKVRIFLSQETQLNATNWDAVAGARFWKSIGGAQIVDYERFETCGPETVIEVAGKRVSLLTSIQEHEILSGKNCAIALRNQESMESVATWLEWHQRWYGLNAAVIVDRNKPQRAQRAAKELDKALKALNVSGLTIILMSATIPLGLAGVGAEFHPMNAPDAPGKDRMDPPKCDRWTAPLAVPTVYELMRIRFLRDCRAVMNIDVHDYLQAPFQSDGSANQANVFDMAAEAPQGFVSLIGNAIYPWNVRKNQEPVLGDHICLQFDNKAKISKWCVAPSRLPESAVLRPYRVPGVGEVLHRATFWRCMALRYGETGDDGRIRIASIVPKSSLIEDPELLALSAFLEHKPLRMPEVSARDASDGNGRVTIVTTMKNEGPFILEWIAYHRSIGVTDFLVYTNDCTDGTDTLLNLLQEKGIVQHRNNPFREMAMKPQHAALADAANEEMVQTSEWLVCMDVDEFINIHVGDGTLADLFGAVPNANMISMTWRLFGNADIENFNPSFIVEQFTRCAPKMTRKPHQAWGFKTLYKNLGLFRKMGVHRPKGLNSQLKEQVNWVNGSGVPLPETEYRNAWRSTTRTVGYDMVSLNHYALRSAESFLVKRDRGRVNHVDRDQGNAYWFRMNNNKEEDLSIQRRIPALQKEIDELLADPDIAREHENCVRAHRARIDELKATENYMNFFNELIGERFQKLSRLHAHFGANVFLAGPSVVPDAVWQSTLPEDFFFTVEKTETSH